MNGVISVDSNTRPCLRANVLCFSYYSLLWEKTRTGHWQGRRTEALGDALSQPSEFRAHSAEPCRFPTTQLVSAACALPGHSKK